MRPDKIASCVIAAALVGAAFAPATRAADFREHRGVYISPYVSDWPTSAITTYTAKRHKEFLTQSLDRLQAGGVNVVYFAVRPLCDAMYKSQYEPWSQCATGTRGKEPPFDPLGFLIEEAHARGIEVYTWLNAYRYCTIYKHGESPLDYELTHPEWLLVQSHETILNPALEEVKQRVCDVAADIVDHYDIDGFLFDDYYYSNPTPMEVDAEYYKAAYDADPSVGTQIEWRCANVSSMIERVSNVVKTHKPWVVFGIKPAGVASPPNIRDYGLEPSPDIREKDWQYNAVAADPVYWYSQHWADFIAPQIYWCDLFNPLQDWWAVASRKFDRHLYSAVSMSKFADFGAAEFAREVEYARTTQADNISGLGFFRFFYYINEGGKIDDVRYNMPEYMGKTAFATPALHPVRPWNNVYEPAMVTGLKRDGSTLTWDAVEGMRYTIYAFRAGEEQRPYNTNLVQVRYTNSYEIPESLAGCTFGVAVYDRYGNEYSMSTEGATLSADPVVPKLTYPADGAVTPVLFDFIWEPTGCDNIVEVSETPDFEVCLVKMATAESSLTSFVLNNIEGGKTYYWRVRATGINAPVGTSDIHSFTASNLELQPLDDDQPTTPTFAWTAAYDGAEYLLEMSRNSSFKTIDYSAVTTEPTHTVESHRLYGGMRYYARVKAVRNGRESASQTISFWTADADQAAPTFVSPAAEGVTIHANQTIEIAVPEGVSSAQVVICKSPEFTGGVYRRTMRDGDFTTPELSTIRISGKYLTDGETYYVKALSRYYVGRNLTVEAEGPSVVTTFVYSSADGVADYVADTAEVYITPEGLLYTGVEGCAVGVYAVDGRCVYFDDCAAATVDLSAITPGIYVVRVSGPVTATIKYKL